jgi:hypothetical protein
MYTVEGPEDGGKAPNGPNFLLIVVLFCVTIMVGLGLAFFFIPGAGRMMHMVRPDPHPTSQVIVRGAVDVG